MLEAENIFQFKLTLTDSFPEVWRRILVPDECTLGDLHYVISYSFCWFQDSLGSSILHKSTAHWS
jgi:hypothetical protein